MRVFTILIAALLALGCEPKGEHPDGEHEHGHGEDEHGHDDHDDHDDQETVSWTDYGEKTQLFAEYGRLEPGHEVQFRLHLTQVAGWVAISDGTVRVELTLGENTVRTEPVSAVRPGIFEAKLKVPAGASDGTLRVVLERATGGAIHTRSVGVDERDDRDDKPHSHEEPITFLLEQQWSIDFGMARVAKRRVRASFEAYGSLRPTLGGEGVVHAPAAGRVVGDNLPMLGSTVNEGDELAWLVPALADQGDLAGLDLALARAQVDVRAAEAQRTRLEALVRDGVIPSRRLVEARFAEEQARASLAAARQRMGQARGASGSGSRRPAGSVTLRAPLTGVVVAVDVPPGLYVEAGQSLFRIVDPDPLWLEVAIPEVHVALLPRVTGVWFEIDGFEQPFEVSQGRLAIGGAVDKHSRTLPVIAEVPNPDGLLRPGMFANVHVIEGEPNERLAVPTSAIVRQDGIDLAFVGIDGESFERRALKLGARDGEVVEVLSGLRDGEWVVTRGSFAVRLAALGDQSGAGHHH